MGCGMITCQIVSQIYHSNWFNSSVWAESAPSFRLNYRDFRRGGPARQAWVPPPWAPGPLDRAGWRHSRWPPFTRRPKRFVSCQCRSHRRCRSTAAADMAGVGGSRLSQAFSHSGPRSGVGQRKCLRSSVFPPNEISRLTSGKVIKYSWDNSKFSQSRITNPTELGLGRQPSKYSD